MSQTVLKNMKRVCASVFLCLNTINKLVIDCLSVHVCVHVRVCECGKMPKKQSQVEQERDGERISPRATLLTIL